MPQNVLVSIAEVSSDKENEDEDDVPLANLSSNSSGSNIKTANRVYRWRKHDTPVADRTFQGTFTEPREEELTPLQCFKLFLKDEILNTIVENTNLYSVQKSENSVNTNKDEISVADVMPINRYEKLRKCILLTTMLQTMIMINCLK